MGISKQELEQAFVDLGPKYGGLKEDYFALLHLVKEFGGSMDERAYQVAFGGNDYGFDAFHVDPVRRNLYLFQFKWSENHNLFKESLQRLIRVGMERVFGNPLQDQEQNPLLLQIKSALHENEAVIERVIIRFVFNGSAEAAEQSATLDALRESLESKKFLIDQRFHPREVTLTLEYVENETRRVGGASRTKRTHRYELDLKASLVHRIDGHGSLHVGFVRLMDLYRMYAEMKTRLFERNIRAGLSAEMPVNRAIRKGLAQVVLNEQESPDVFAFNHNGVTIFAEQLELEGERTRITEPRILNGAQTVTSLARFLEENEGNKALKSNAERLEQIRVLAKIISGVSPEFVVNVTLCNNRQNPVNPWNLRASDSLQLELQDKFREDLGVYYERQENAFESLTDEDLEEMGIEQHKAVQIKRLAQTFLAAQGEIDKMSRLVDVFESEKEYRAAFKPSYLQTDCRRILLAYKVQFRLNRIVREITEKGTSKYAFLGRARNLVWALLIQGLLNDPKLESLREQFGASLVVEADYSERLKDLASRKIRLILSEATSDSRYKELLALEKYSFLRTRATYQRCMEIAFEKYGWKKMPL